MRRVTLYTGRLEETKHFYCEHLGFPMIKEEDQSFSIQVGESELRFINYNRTDGRHPFYHFAFTVCGNQFAAAKEWIKEKVTLNTHKGEDEVTFRWGTSLYFEDPSGNIVEFYGRNRFKNEKTTFSLDDVIEMSEINLTTRDCLKTGEALVQAGFIHLDEGPLSENDLNFVGWPDSYFLVGPIGRVWFFSDKPAESHPVKVELSGGIEVVVDDVGAFHIKK